MNKQTLEQIRKLILDRQINVMVISGKHKMQKLPYGAQIKDGVIVVNVKV